MKILTSILSTTFWSYSVQQLSNITWTSIGAAAASPAGVTEGGGTGAGRTDSGISGGSCLMVGTLLTNGSALTERMLLAPFVVALLWEQIKGYDKLLLSY